MVKNRSCITISSEDPLYRIISKKYGCIGKSNENKYLMVVPIDKTKETLKNYEELWNN